MHDSKSLTFILDHVERKFASSPSGGSTTILLDLCKMPSGNYGVGLVVNQSLKSLCALRISSLSSKTSSLGNHFLSKWQFCRNTHVPLTIAVLIASSAFSSDPCPSDSSNMFTSSSSFLPMMSALGSAPGLSIYKIGVLLSDILYISWILGYLGLTYSGPILSTIHILMPSFNLSILNTFNTHIFDNMSIALYPHGISESSGTVSSYHARHCVSLFWISSTMLLNLLSRVWSSSMSFQFCSDSQEMVLTFLGGSRDVFPRSRKLNKPTSIFFWLSRMRDVRWNANINLCFSNNPRQP